MFHLLWSIILNIITFRELKMMLFNILCSVKKKTKQNDATNSMEKVQIFVHQSEDCAIVSLCTYHFDSFNWNWDFFILKVSIFFFDELFKCLYDCIITIRNELHLYMQHTSLATYISFHYFSFCRLDTRTEIKTAIEMLHCYIHYCYYRSNSNVTNYKDSELEIQST